MSDRGKFGLTYTLTDCRCGAERVAAYPCGDCGASPKPHEFDPHVQRRARLRSEVLRVLSVTDVQTLKADSPLALINIAIEGMQGWLTRLWSILDKSRPKAEVIVAHVDKLRALRQALEDFSELRPWRGMFKTLLDTADAMYLAFEKTLDAYAAPVPLEAQRLQREMQSHIDRAADLIGTFASSADEFATLDSTEGIEQKVLLSLVTQMSDQRGNRGSDALLALIPDGVDVPVGLREFMAFFVRMTQTFGEDQAFIDTASAVFSLLAANSSKAYAGLMSDRYRADFERSLNEAYSSAATFEIVMAAARNEQVVLDGVMEVAHSIVESASRPHSALLASCFDARQYRGVFADGANAVIGALLRNGCGSIVNGLSVLLRNAKAHKAYRLSEDGRSVVLFKDNGNVKRILSGPEIADMIIAGHVTTLGLIAGCYLAAVALEANAAQLLPDNSAFSVEATLSVIYVVLGWLGVSVSLDGDSVHVENCPPLSASAISSVEFTNFLTGISPVNSLPPHITKIVLHGLNGESLEVDVDVAKNIRSVSEIDVISRITAVFKVRQGDRRAASSDEIRFILAGLAIDAVRSEPQVGIRSLRRLKSIALEHDDETFAAALTSSITAIRSKIMGIDAPYVDDPSGAFRGLVKLPGAV